MDGLSRKFHSNGWIRGTPIYGTLYFPGTNCSFLAATLQPLKAAAFRTVDSEKLARALDKAWRSAYPERPLGVMVQVNSSGEETKMLGVGSYGRMEVGKLAQLDLGYQWVCYYYYYCCYCMYIYIYHMFVCICESLCISVYLMIMVYNYMYACK